MPKFIIIYWYVKYIRHSRPFVALHNNERATAYYICICWRVYFSFSFRFIFNRSYMYICHFAHRGRLCRFFAILSMSVRGRQNRTSACRRIRKYTHNDIIGVGNMYLLHVSVCTYLTASELFSKLYEYYFLILSKKISKISFYIYIFFYFLR